MGGSQKSKRVTWASDEYLCQVRLFLSEECPSQVGMGAQDHLQAKASWASHPSSIMSDDNLPPGFEGTQPVNLFKSKLSQIPVIKWRCPPKFLVNAAWRVVAGEESKEVEIQSQREMRVLEAIYPRPSAIPPNPSTISGAEDPVYHDQQTPLIPITPIEDEDAGADVCDSATVTTIPMSSQPQPIASGASSSRLSAANLSTHAMPATEAVAGVGPDVLAALSTFLSTNNQGNLIDGSLLIKFLNDPKMVEQLVRNHAAASSSAQTMPSTTMPVTSMQMQTMTPPTSQQSARVTSVQNRPRPVSQAVMSLSETVPITMNRTEQHFPHMTRPELGAPPVAAAATSGVYFPPPTRVSSVPNLRPMVPDVVFSAPTPSVGAPVKDINYYKSLIQQHGGDRQETVTQFGNRINQQLGSIREPSNNPKPRELKTKIMKPCIYFNSSRGCRNGANCAYQHDTSQQRVSAMPEPPSAKRMKMDSSITGS